MSSLLVLEAMAVWSAEIVEGAPCLRMERICDQVNLTGLLILSSGIDIGCGVEVVEMVVAGMVVSAIIVIVMWTRSGGLLW